MSDNVLFTEEFRPTTLDECALPERIVNEVKNGLTQNILLYSASPGTGKTTLTKILSQGYETLYVNGSASGIDKVREEIESFSGTYSILDNGKPKVVILEEMDGLTQAAFNALRAVIETFASNVRFIGNCNNLNKIPAPIQSRFNCIPVYPITDKERQEWFIKSCTRTMNILSKLDIKCDPKLVAALVKQYLPNMRSVINIIQSLYVQGVKEITKDQVVKAENNLSAENNDAYKLFDMMLDKNTEQLALYDFLKTKFSDNCEELISTIASSFIDYAISKNSLGNAIANKIGNIAVVTSNYMNQLPTSLNKFITMYALVTSINIIVKS